MNSGYLSNNIANDGIACESGGYIVYNQSSSIVLESLHGLKKVILYDGYFLNIESQYVFFALKTDGFSLYQYNIKTEECKRLVCAEVKWVHQVNDFIYYTCNDTNFLFAYHLPTGISRLLLKQSCNYLCIIGCKIYFSNWSCDKSLWVYDISTNTSSKILDSDVAWINVVDTNTLVFRSWHNRKTYIYSLVSGEKKLLNADGANYLHYRDGYIYYANTRLGGLWRQSIGDKSQKSCIYGESIKRINSTTGILLFQDAHKKLIRLRLSNIKDLPILQYIEMIVTTRCNILCANCSNGIPYVEHSDVSYECFCEQLNKLLNKVSYIHKFQIHGGEPFLNPDLPKIVKYANASQKLLNIRIATNGSIIPSYDLIQALKNTRIVIAISSYGFNVETRKQLVKICEDNGIKYILYKEKEWYSFDPLYRGKNRYETCPINSFPCYYNGKVYLCSRICHMYGKLYMDSCINLDNLSIDLLEALNGDELKKPCIECGITNHMILAGT